MATTCVCNVARLPKPCKTNIGRREICVAPIEGIRILMQDVCTRSTWHAVHIQHSFSRKWWMTPLRKTRGSSTITIVPKMKGTVRGRWTATLSFANSRRLHISDAPWRDSSGTVTRELLFVVRPNVMKDVHDFDLFIASQTDKFGSPSRLDLKGDPRCENDSSSEMRRKILLKGILL